MVRFDRCGPHRRAFQLVLERWVADDGGESATPLVEGERVGDDEVLARVHPGPCRDRVACGRDRTGVDVDAPEEVARDAPSIEPTCLQRTTRRKQERATTTRRIADAARFNTVEDEG